MTPRKYATPSAFKEALEVRLRARARELSTDIARVRQIVVFERFLARVASYFGTRAVVKGGVVLELRLGHARATRDIDLAIGGRPDQILVELRRAGQLHLGDFLTFEVDPHPKHPLIEGEGIIYEGRRFRATAVLDGKGYGSFFGVDVALGERMPVSPEIIRSSSFLEFLGLQPVDVHACAREVHVAEKLHALTMPRARENSRVKDLPDLALLALTGPFQSIALRDAIRATFNQRGTHSLPASIPLPPASWVAQYAVMAEQSGFQWATIADVVEAVRAFLEPILQGEDGEWDPASWSWRRIAGL